MSDDLARTNSELAKKYLQRSERRKAVRKQFNMWKRAIDSIIEDAKTTPFDSIVDRLKSLPLDAVNLAFDAESADNAINEVAKAIRLRPTSSVGVWEQFASDDLVFVWLWNDL